MLLRHSRAGRHLPAGAITSSVPSPPRSGICSAAGSGSRSRAGSTSPTALASLPPAARPAFERLVAAAREAGFPVRVLETSRSAERQAYLMVVGGGLTLPHVELADRRLGYRSVEELLEAARTGSQ